MLDEVKKLLLLHQCLGGAMHKRLLNLGNLCRCLEAVNKKRVESKLERKNIQGYKQRSLVERT